MKKFLAGALAAALVLSVPAPAFAAGTKTVKTQGEVEYEVEVSSPNIVLNLVLPSDFKIALNPYGNEFRITDMDMIHTQNGIVSVAYPVLNYETGCGVFFDVTAVTSTSSKKWSVTKTPLTPGVKGANMAFVAAETPEGIINYSPVPKAATSASDQGNLPLDSTTPYDKDKGLAKGQCKQNKVAYIPAAVDEDTPSRIYLGFTGILADDSDTTPVNWTEDDIINVNLVLKITPGPRNL